MTLSTDIWKATVGYHEEQGKSITAPNHFLGLKTSLRSRDSGTAPYLSPLRVTHIH